MREDRSERNEGLPKTFYTALILVLRQSNLKALYHHVRSFEMLAYE